MKNTTLESILQTDLYQLTMGYAALALQNAGETTGFESFVRKIKPNITDNNYYTFNAEIEVRSFINKVKKEIREPDFFDRYWEMIKNKVNENSYKTMKSEFESIYKFFDYTVMSNGSKINAFVPVFQYKGPKFFGQMLETPITNIINGKVGINSYKGVFNIHLDSDIYKHELKRRAIQYRNATTKIILEAGYRRAPSFSVAQNASRIAIKENWNGTSNTSIFEEIDQKKINGSMAHAYIMSFEENGKPNELKAFKTWNTIFPNSTILIDTYDSVKAVRILIDNNIKPAAVRIDSDPIEELAFKVRKELDNADWRDVKIFLSGDITPEKLIQWEKDNVPFDICMAGTHYVNIDGAENINPGFVYKIVEFTRSNGKTEFPIKKAFGKSNYPGLKSVYFNEKDNILTVTKSSEFGFFNDSLENVNNETEIIFEGLF